MIKFTTKNQSFTNSIYIVKMAGVEPSPNSQADESKSRKPSGKKHKFFCSLNLFFCFAFQRKIMICLFHLNQVSYLMIQSNLWTTTTLGIQKKWLLLKGGRCLEVIYNLKNSKCDLKLVANQTSILRIT